MTPDESKGERWADSFAEPGRRKGKKLTRHCERVSSDCSHADAHGRKALRPQQTHEEKRTGKEERERERKSEKERERERERDINRDRRQRKTGKDRKRQGKTEKDRDREKEKVCVMMLLRRSQL